MRRAPAIRLASVLAAALSLAAATVTLAAEPVRYRMSTITSETSPWTLGAKRFADLVAQRTKDRAQGQIQIEVFPNGSLSQGNQVREREMVQQGVIHFFYYSNLLLTLVEPKFNVISLPWLLPDTGAVDRVLEGPVGEQLLALLPAKGIIGLAWGENGYRQLTNNTRAVAAPADLKGLKIRVPGVRMYSDIFGALGANPVTMNFGEVFTALQQGTIDGQENPIVSVIVPSKLYEVQKHLTLWDYSYDALVLGASKQVFDQLDEPIRKVLRDSAIEASAYQRDLARKGEQEAIELMRSKGVAITRVTPEQRKGFQELTAPVVAKYEGIVGKDLLDAFRKAAAAR
jgi:tripartite ATP-independent transporter DctP family solute receptor